MWHSVEVLFKCNVEDDQSEILYDQSIFLIYAKTQKEINEKAIKLMKTSSIDYKNYEGKTVQWQFVKILSIYNICAEKIYDGIEVFSQLHWESELQF